MSYFLMFEKEKEKKEEEANATTFNILMTKIGMLSIPMGGKNIEDKIKWLFLKVNICIHAEPL